MEATLRHILPPSKKPNNKLKYWIGAAIFIFIVIIIFSFRGVDEQQEKKISITLTESQWKLEVNKLNYVSGRLRYTNLPASDVAFMQDSILVPLQLIVINQLNQQLKDTTNKTKPNAN